MKWRNHFTPWGLNCKLATWREFYPSTNNPAPTPINSGGLEDQQYPEQTFSCSPCSDKQKRSYQEPIFPERQWRLGCLLRHHRGADLSCCEYSQLIGVSWWSSLASPRQEKCHAPGLCQSTSWRQLKQDMKKSIVDRLTPKNWFLASHDISNFLLLKQ